MTKQSKEVSNYWQNEAKNLQAQIDGLEKKLEATSFGYGLLLQEIRNAKEHIEKKVDDVRKEIESFRYRIK